MYKQYTLIFVVIKVLICLSQGRKKKNMSIKLLVPTILIVFMLRLQVLDLTCTSGWNGTDFWVWGLILCQLGQGNLSKDVINPAIHLKDLIHNFLYSLVVYLISKDDTLPDIYHRIQDMLGKQVFFQTFKNLYFYSKNLVLLIYKKSIKWHSFWFLNIKNCWPL